ncbi:uncharacterized protein [Antedon mediterranea]|uniref:uncharacterized protein n=1 Tax=Antedon mediterranea TaxID=105859 RepID=UPI003AF6E2C2
MAAALGAVKSLSSITPDEGNQLLEFDSAIVMIQSRLPVLLALLAILRDTFGDSGTKCYPPEYVSNTESVKYINAYCTYRENDDLIGYHEFVPFSFTLQAVLIQIPILIWIACGGRKISMVAMWFAKCCREICSEAEFPIKSDTVADEDDGGANSNDRRNWPKVHSIMQCYINEWSVSRTYVLAYFLCKVLLCCATCASLTYHYLLLRVTIEPYFLNNEFSCDVEDLNTTINCIKPYEIFNQILIIIDLVLCLALPLAVIILRESRLLLTMFCGWQKSISDFIPFLEIPKGALRFNNTNILAMYYKENIGLDEKYVQKILVPWKTSVAKTNEVCLNELCTTEKTCF